MVTAEAVRKIMSERGLKTKWVAGEIGVKPKTLSAFLRGETNLGTSAQILLCKVLEIKASEAS